MRSLVRMGVYFQNHGPLPSRPGHRHIRRPPLITSLPATLTATRVDAWARMTCYLQYFVRIVSRSANHDGHNPSQNTVSEAPQALTRSAKTNP